MTTKYQAPFPMGYQFCDDNGDPLASGTINTYVTGSTTNKATYKDNAGAASHANPIVLGADGRVPGDALWLDNDQDYTFLLKDSDGVTVWSADDIAAIVPAVTATQSEWVNGPTPTYISATSFSVAGDYTGTLHAGRRLKLVDASTVYASIVATAYSGGITTVTVVCDDGASLSSSLASFQYGLASANNMSGPYMPRVALSDAAHSVAVWASYVITPTATRVQTLPTTGVVAGDQVEFANLASAQKITINASNGSAKASFQNGTMLLYALQDTPTTPAHWGIKAATGGGSPSFAAYLSAAQGGDFTTATKVAWDSEQVDSNGDFDSTTNNRFTPLVPGPYHMIAQVTVGSVTSGNVDLLLYKNGSAYRRFGCSARGALYIGNIVEVVEANGTTDYFEVYVVTSADAAATVDDVQTTVVCSWFSGARIG